MLIFISKLIIYAINAYLIIITIRIFISWFNLPPGPFVRFISNLTDPVLSYFRKNFPIRLAIFDLSIFIPIIILSITAKVISELIINGVPFSAYYLLSLIVIIIYWIYGFIAFALFITAVIFLFVESKQDYAYNPFINSIRKIFYPVMYFLQKYIKLRSRHAARIYILIIIALIIILGLLGQKLLMDLYSYLYNANIFHHTRNVL
jgi:uncharacterized protein YggT (Ycf19 family)